MEITSGSEQIAMIKGRWSLRVSARVDHNANGFMYACHRCAMASMLSDTAGMKSSKVIESLQERFSRIITYPSIYA